MVLFRKPKEPLDFSKPAVGKTVVAAALDEMEKTQNNKQEKKLEEQPIVTPESIIPIKMCIEFKVHNTEQFVDIKDFEVAMVQKYGFNIISKNSVENENIS